MKPRWHDTDERPGSTCQCVLLCGDEEGETFEWYYIAAIYDSKKDQFQIPLYHCDNSLFAYRCHRTNSTINPSISRISVHGADCRTLRQ